MVNKIVDIDVLRSGVFFEYVISLIDSIVGNKVML